jgi:hypothetical protein
MSSPAPDLDHIDVCFMSALRAIERGCRLSEPIAVPPFGRSSKVDEALSLASRYLDEPFHAEQLSAADAACRAIGLTRRSDNKRETARAIFETMMKNKRKR